MLSGFANREQNKGLAKERFITAILARGMMSNEQRATVENSPRSKRTIIASLAALGSVVLASSCCLPLLPFLFAAGAAGTSAFFVKVRPFLLAASVLLIAFGFYQRRRAKKCKCQPSIMRAVLLWISAMVVLLFILFHK